jgi:fumarate hydratase class II
MMGLLNPLVMAAIMPQMAAMMGMDPAAAAASLQGNVRLQYVLCPVVAPA